MNDLDAHGRINFRHLVWMRLQKYRREATWGTYQSESFKTALGDAIKQQQAAAENGHVDDGEMLESRAAASSNSQNAATHEHQRPPKRPTLAPQATYASESATPASGVSGAATASCSPSHAVTAESEDDEGKAAAVVMTPRRHHHAQWISRPIKVALMHLPYQYQWLDCPTSAPLR